MEEELSKELELQIKGAEKPTVWGLLCIRFILLPYTLGKLLLWNGSWFWRYKVKRAAYSLEDASYLTRRSLKVPFDSWKYMDESTRENLVHRLTVGKNQLPKLPDRVAKRIKAQKIEELSIESSIRKVACLQLYGIIHAHWCGDF